MRIIVTSLDPDQHQAIIPETSSHSSKAFNKEREKLVLESQRAIKRKQHNAKRQQSQSSLSKEEGGSQEIIFDVDDDDDDDDSINSSKILGFTRTTYDWSNLSNHGISTTSPSSDSAVRQIANENESKGRSRSLSRTPQKKDNARVEEDYRRHRSYSSDQHHHHQRRSKSLSTHATSRCRSKSPVGDERRKNVIHPNERVSGADRSYGQDKNDFPAASSPWHDAIARHDWDTVEDFLRCFDHTKYMDKKQQQQSPNNPSVTRKKSQKKKKLRVLKYLPTTAHVQGVSSEDISSHGRDEDTKNKSESNTISPLLQVDENGRTPLHLACTEQMPEKLLLKLYFVGRDATAIQDAEGRYPIHLALIHNLSTQVLDRFIHSSARLMTLGDPDCFNHTPIQYAILQASYTPKS